MKARVNSMSVVLPAFNEEAVIAQTVIAVYDYVSKIADDFEVIVVNDGSTDMTAVQVRGLQKDLPKLVLLEHAVNRGYGEALRTGFNAALGEWILQMDSDGQFRIESLDAFLPEMANYEMVAGYREKRADARYRALLTWGYMSLLNLLFDLPIRDVGCAFKLFKRRTWQLVEPIIESRDHKIFLVEWISRAKEAGISIKEMPVRHYIRAGGKPTGAKAEVVGAMLKQLFNLKTQNMQKMGWFRWVRRAATTEYTGVLLTIVGVKLVIFVISMVAFAMFNSVPDVQPLGVFLPGIWNRWDTLYWYVNIADNGYSADGNQANGIAFMPLYPLLIRLGGIVIQNNLWSALWIANVLSILGLLMFYRLARYEFGQRTAWWALLALIFFPSAYFFNAAYTEGPFLLFMVSSFYFARRGNWQWAGLFGGLAALTRIVGIILWPALVVEFLLQRRDKRQSWGEIVWLLAIPGGLAVYLLYNMELFGFAFAFMQQLDGYWQKHFAWPWVGLESRWQAIGPFPYSSDSILAGWAELIAGIILIIGSVWSLVKLRLSYTIYLAGLSFMLLSTNVLQSTPRYLLAAFPVFFLMGIMAKFRLLRVVWLPFSISILVLFMTYFVSGGGGTF
jgi:glycosyltransferase involved in cell wall biosynthesis